MVKEEASQEKDIKVFKGLAKGLAVGCVITLAVFIALAAVLTYTDVSESVILFQRLRPVILPRKTRPAAEFSGEWEPGLYTPELFSPL